jgi:hypothetical protein
MGVRAGVQKRNHSCVKSAQPGQCQGQRAELPGLCAPVILALDERASDEVDEFNVSLFRIDSFAGKLLLEPCHTR